MLVNLRSLIDEIIICCFSRSEISILIRASLSTTSKEDDTRNFAFATIVCTKEILEGEEITSLNTWPKRPGIGEINAWDHQKILGRKASRNLSKEEHIRWKDLEEK